MATVINYLVLDERALIPLIDACNNIDATTSNNVTSELYLNFYNLCSPCICQALSSLVDLNYIE